MSAYEQRSKEELAELHRLKREHTSSVSTLSLKLEHERKELQEGERAKRGRQELNSVSRDRGLVRGGHTAITISLKNGPFRVTYV